MSLDIVIPDTFNGPLGLLHSLIVRDEIDIHDIPIAKLTAGYCEEISRLAVIDIDEGAEFLDLASRLQDIKLRMLLPPEERLDEDGEEEIDDPRSTLVESLLEYRRFKDAARLLDELAEEQERRYPRISPKMQFRFIEPEEDGNDSLSLLMAMQSMLDRFSAPEIIESREIPIATRIEQIREVLGKRETARFSLLLSTNPQRGEIVAFFIAMLELIRRGELRARQTDNFSDIILERREPEPEPTTGMRGAYGARGVFGAHGAYGVYGGGSARTRGTACFPVAMLLRAKPQSGHEPEYPQAEKRRGAFPAAEAFARRGAPDMKAMKTMQSAKKAFRAFPAAPVPASIQRRVR